MDQELPDAAAYASGSLVSTRQMSALFCVKWRQGAILKVGRHIRNLTPSTDAIYLKNVRAIEFHPDPICNDGALGFLPRDAL